MRDNQEGHQYTYSTVKAKKFGLIVGETPDHKFEYIKRTDHLIPKNRVGHIHHQPRCSCGWKGKEWYINKNAGKRAEWEGHMMATNQQGNLFL
jgi:hypothetical protein